MTVLFDAYLQASVARSLSSYRCDRAMPSPYDWVDASLNTLRRADWYRQVQTIEGRCGPTITIDGHEMVNLASNDYLGFAGEQVGVDAAIAATQAYGTGATGSRLLSGHRALHRDLERAIAQLKGTEDALVFSSGYLANIGTITAIVNSRDLVLSDEYNHASLKSGAKLSGATVLSYSHCNMSDLAQKLKENRTAYRRCLILTDGVFGMDGDVCPLPVLLAMAQQFEAMVMVDEAHSAGVLGPTGAGCLQHFGCEEKNVIQMGTLSKAFASLGGYVAGRHNMIDFLRNRAATWIYTTGLSPADTAAALSAIAQLQQSPHRLQQLHKNVQSLTKKIDRLIARLPRDEGHAIACKRLSTESAIVCIQVTDAATVLTLSQQLQAKGVFVSAVRPPTVPVSRLRMSVMATHTPAHIESAARALQQVFTAHFRG